MNPFISSCSSLVGSFLRRVKEEIMITKSGSQKTVVPNRSSVLRPLFVTPILLLVLAFSGCNDSYPNYNATVDKLLGQSNVELVHALSDRL